jgi:5-methyltetrahydropteroyltriglutamate--homocysteine methyltransferase
MSARTKPPFRAEHVGSLLRPPAVKKAREDHAAGRVDAAALRKIEDDAIRAAVKMQERLGLQVATDGEIRRRHWHSDFIYQLSGFTKRDDLFSVPFHRQNGGDVLFTQEQVDITGKIKLDHVIFAEDFSFLKSACTGAVPKLTIPSLNMATLAVYAGDISKAYKRREDAEADIVAAYQAEIAGLAKLGCAYLQLDDVSFAMLADKEWTSFIYGSTGLPYERVPALNVELFNASVKNRPAGMTIGTHTCRGNFQSGWVTTGSYDFVAEAYFGGLAVDAFFVEYDDERSGNFAPLRYVPKGKMVVLGIVTSKTPQLESKDQLKRRIDEAAKYVPLDQLCLSPQCGFASTHEGNALTPDQQEAKLRLVVETAREVWG